MGHWLLQRIAKSNDSVQNWWSLGRIGSREPLYASVHQVIPVSVAEQWLESLLSYDLKKMQEAIPTIALMARLTGDRERDINPELRKKIMERLKAARAHESSLSIVSRVQKLSEADQKNLFGESLPPGLKLLA